MVTITTEVRMPPCAMPGAEQARKLMELVFALRPDLDTRTDRSFAQLNHLRAFTRAFWAMTVFGRLENPDHGRGVTYWSSAANNLLADIGIEDSIPRHIATAVAIASGDVPYARDALGLTWPGSGRPASGAWLSVLKTGNVRAPSAEQMTRHRPGTVNLIDVSRRDVAVGYVPGRPETW